MTPSAGRFRQGAGCGGSGVGEGGEEPVNGCQATDLQLGALL